MLANFAMIRCPTTNSVGVMVWVFRSTNSSKEQPGAGVMWSRNANDTSSGDPMMRVEREGIFTWWSVPSRDGDFVRPYSNIRRNVWSERIREHVSRRSLNFKFDAESSPKEMRLEVHEASRFMGR